MGKSVAVLGSHSREWKAHDGSVWMVDTTWAELAGRAECVSVTLRSCGIIDGQAEPLRARAEVMPVRSDVVRSFPVSVLEEVRESITWFFGDEGPYVDGHEAHEREAASRPFERPGRRGVKLSGPDGDALPVLDALAEVARVYRAEVELAGREGRRARPNVAVADHFTMTPKAAARRVARARDAGLLEPTEQGRAAPVGK